MKTFIEYLNEAGTPNHTSNCAYNYGHDCNCGMKGKRHSDSCKYPHGGDCSCGLKDEEKKKMSQSKRAKAMGMF